MNRVKTNSMSRYLLLPLYAFMACGLMYCTQPDETLETIEEKVQPPVSAADVELLSQFDVYTIDGKATNDTERVLAEVENAYVKLFDYDGRELSIYTSEASYLRAVETDADLQTVEKRRNEAIATADSQVNTKGSDPVMQTEGTYHYQDFPYPDHSAHLVFHHINGANQYWTHGAYLLLSYPNVSTNFFVSGHYNQSGSENVSHGGWLVRDGLYSTQFSNRSLHIRNTSNTNIYLYFYQNTNYSGGYTRVRVSANTTVKLTNSNTRPGGALAKSMWADISFY